ncbi:SAP domain-containing protein [Cardiosporidium cionae]|uniref:SAP domain-containing protein n=1 Tax=Cardiosporidium cionae TaxID=476202 RepID=A0ABQ7JA50_9APIC|nr:SAP domain-containing protein [Cardiosporidium cionae]|eukprot:KAF8820881.1 SAP domain-containing protein [Cardiosporidium cionae]
MRLSSRTLLISNPLLKQRWRELYYRSIYLTVSENAIRLNIVSRDDISVKPFVRKYESANNSNCIMDVDFSTLKIPALKILLAKRGLSVAGRKNELIERLLLAQNQTSSGDPQKESISINDRNPGSMTNERQKVLLQSTVAATSALISEGTKGGNGPHASATTSNAVNSNIPKVESSLNITQLTDEQRLEFRKQKFGLVNEDEKKIARAKRFNLWTPEIEAEKRKQRSARFGTQSSSPAALTADVNPKSAKQIIADMKAPVDSVEVERRKARALRFGIVDEGTKVRLRMERFGIVDEEEKKRRRIERFGVV